jgi:hypothetical protein
MEAKAVNQKTFLAVSGTIFGVIALLHLARILAGWPARIGTFDVPTWCSWVSLVVAGGLACSAFRLHGHR